MTASAPANSSARLVLSGFFLMCAVFSAVTIFAPGKGGVALQVMSVVFSAVLLGLAYRSATAGVRIDENAVTYRSLVRIQRWPVSEVRQFEVRPGRVGALAYRRNVLWIALLNGEDRKLEMLNYAPSDQRTTDVAASLNSQLPG